MWNRYSLEMRFGGLVMGGVPKHPDIIKSWLDARAPTRAPDDAIPLLELAEQVALAVQAEATAENKVWTGFMSDDEGGLYVPGFHLKAHIKDLANILKDTLGVKALKSKVADRAFVEEDKLYLGKTEPDGYWEHAVHIMTMQGPRSALKRNDYVEQPTVRASLRVLADKVVTEDVLRAIFDYGTIKGFGAERGLGHGRYEYTLTPL